MMLLVGPFGWDLGSGLIRKQQPNLRKPCLSPCGTCVIVVLDHVVRRNELVLEAKGRFLRALGLRA